MEIIPYLAVLASFVGVSAVVYIALRNDRLAAMSDDELEMHSLQACLKGHFDNIYCVEQYRRRMPITQP